MGKFITAIVDVDGHRQEPAKGGGPKRSIDSHSNRFSYEKQKPTAKQHHEKKHRTIHTSLVSPGPLEGCKRSPTFVCMTTTVVPQNGQRHNTGDQLRFHDNQSDTCPFHCYVPSVCKEWNGLKPLHRDDSEIQSNPMSKGTEASKWMHP